jgi:P-type Mg2+ transporter
LKFIGTTIKNFLYHLASQETHTEEVNIAVARAAERLINTSLESPEEILRKMDTSEQGLSEAEALARIDQFGRNEVAHEKAPTWYRQLLKAFINPFIGVLILLAVATGLTDIVFALEGERDFTAVIIISLMVLISVLLTFAQEYQANRAADRLLSLVTAKTTVERQDRGKREVPTNILVPGDILHLSAGDIIPADVYLFDTNNLSVSEAALTGESLPVEKYVIEDRELDETAKAEFMQTASALDLDNIGFMGTHVVSGTAVAIVISTGSNTYFGAMSKELVGHHPPTSFDIGVNRVSLLLIRFMAVMVPIIFLINGITKGDWFQAVLFGLAVAVGLTPEMLPMIVTANLAKGTVEMAQRKTIVKRLNAIQNLGAMNVLCTDKTGTLTYDTVALECYLDMTGYEHLDVLKYTYLNSYYQMGLKNPIDEAVLAHEHVHILQGVEQNYQKVDEIPFETARRRMSVVVEKDNSEHLLICKGAIDEMLSISNRVVYDGKAQTLTDEMRKKINSYAGDLIEGGLRVLLVGYKVDGARENRYGVEDEQDLTLLGYIGFLDPPKETAGEAIAALQMQGVKVKVITGDNEIATRRVCREIGLEVEGLLQGFQVDQMEESELQKAVENTNVFVRMAPLQKSTVVNALKQNGYTVGFLGDGINDAPALRDADVGVSVDNAVDIAKESADIILLEKSLLVLEEGVARGRHVFGNIMKYIKITVSSNFGNVFSVLVASAFLPFQPMMPLQLLIQNLLYDISQISIPWDNVDEEYLRKPREWDPRSIARFALFLGPVSSIFDFSTFALMWYVFAANTVEEQALFQSGWFVLGLLSQTLIVHMIRTHKVPFLQSIASRPVLIMTTVVMVIGLVFPFTPFGMSIGFQPLPTSYFPWLFGTLIAYCIIIQLVKGWYIRRFNMWL